MKMCDEEDIKCLLQFYKYKSRYLKARVYLLTDKITKMLILPGH